MSNFSQVKNEQLLKWLLYSVLFMVLLLPFFGWTLKVVTGSLILGFFAGMLNYIAVLLKNIFDSL